MPLASALMRHKLPLTASVTPTAREQLDIARWHLDRYDRLRVSTSSRAAVVLSAATILSAGNAVILSRQLRLPADLPRLLAVAVTIALISSTALVVCAIIFATRVLVSLKSSRAIFPSANLPSGFLFNATDTVKLAPNFGDFEKAAHGQTWDDILRASYVELWTVIRQHRHRYSMLRRAIRFLRAAAVIFLGSLISVVTLGLVYYGQN